MEEECITVRYEDVLPGEICVTPSGVIIMKTMTYQEVNAVLIESGQLAHLEAEQEVYVMEQGVISYSSEYVQNMH